MNMSNSIESIRSFDFTKHIDRIKSLADKRMIIVSVIAFAIMVVMSLVFFMGPTNERVFEHINDDSFQDGRILDDRESTYFYGKEKMLSQKAQALLDSQAKLEAKVAALEMKVSSGTVNSTSPPPVGSPTPAPNETAQATTANSAQNETDLKSYPTSDDLSSSASQAYVGRKYMRVRNPDLISFPVKGELPESGVMLPAGSYVKAKILTGVEVPEGKTYPVLMVLDYSYVAPNDRKVDLSGCFMIAKAEGNLSTERVQMQATKLSCVSKRGKMFERDINGFVADDKDGSFAMKGVVNSKQGRVASMAFLASVVDGVGKAVQQGQNTNSITPLGGSTSVLTGNQATAAVAGGASSAASMVAQWYLSQAQNLSPTVAVGSGRTVWIVVKDTVKLPEDFFKKEQTNEGIYSYVTRVLE